MHSQASNENVNLAPKVIKELARELKNLDDSPPEDIKVYVNEENFSNVTADIEGPRKTSSSPSPSNYTELDRVTVE